MELWDWRLERMMCATQKKDHHRAGLTRCDIDVADIMRYGVVAGSKASGKKATGYVVRFVGDKLSAQFAFGRW